ncbi:biotin/lipoyl-containing protein [Planococcus shixiaomingii]|uniref:biotin/lipoyl-containing protein n=1 Tax=Planococcus shixiaomingii TaxID=3058393 RepID=UPI002628FE17|nr:biotin/lipoyl-containing protein [Planococcus sp. N022]WKA55654.1 biotin/lipoyl-containing protein [Planococcus sp. N022]
MIEVRLPQPVEGKEESLIVLWFVSEGDVVEKGDRLVEVETETELMEIEAAESGIIREIIFERGETAKVGDVLALIEPNGNQAASQNQKAPSIQEQSKKDEPLVEESISRVEPGLRKLAKELAVQLEMVNGTGRNGEITEADIRRVAGKNSLEQSEIQSSNEREE